jgi:ACT domain-containing protein
MIVDAGAVKSFAQMAEELEELGKEIGVVIKCQHEDIFESMHRI